MARLKFRDRFFTPPVGRALISPWSILLFGGVTAASILVLPIGAAIGLGVVAYATKVLFAIPRGAKGERIDPFVLSEPWRGYVQSAQSAKLRFDRTVAGTRSGPLRDRLSELSRRLEDGIEESWRIASRGDDIDSALAQLDTTKAVAELAQLQAQSQSSADSDVGSTIQSLQAQISSAQRMQQVSTSTRNRLRLLDARFDELVARAVEVSVGSGDSGVLGDDVNGLVSELESLRLAMDDTKRAETGDADVPGVPPPAALQEAPPDLGVPLISAPAPDQQKPQARPSQ